MDNMNEPMAGECSVCHAMVTDMMAHMKEMAGKGDAGHQAAMDTWMAEHPDGKM